MLPFFLLYSLAFVNHQLSVVRSTDQSTTSEFKDWQNFLALELTMIQRPASAQPKTRKGKAGKRKIRFWIFVTKALTCVFCVVQSGFFMRVTWVFRFLMSRFSSSGVKRNNERISNCTAAAVSRSSEIGSTAVRSPTKTIWWIIPRKE